MRIARRGLRRWLMILLVTAVGLATGCGSALNTEQEVRLGEQNAPRFLKEAGGPIPDKQVRQYVKDLGQRLTEQIKAEDRRGLPWEFHAVDSATINAFALPGGKVFITRGLMSKLENEAQLAGVLGHEIGHVVAEHIGKQMNRAMWTRLGVSVVGAATESQWARTLGGFGGNLFMLKYGREQELEADGIGVIYMSRLNYDPAAMLGVLKVLDQAGGGRGVEMLSTHPHPESRAEQLRAMLSGQLAHTQNKPQYKLEPGPYQAKVLSPLKALPPPKHGTDKQ